MSGLEKEEFIEIQEEFYTLRHFFDIYENAEMNDEISEYAQEYNLKNSLLENDVDFIALLPNYSTLVTQYERNQLAERTLSNVSANSINVNNATSYATNPNTSGYGYLVHDCTNFASQILHAGGRLQEITNSTSTGWWHKLTSSGHLHSTSWAYAANFVLYLGGPTYSTTAFTTLSTKLQAGDFIIGDWENDG